MGTAATRLNSATADVLAANRARNAGITALPAESFESSPEYFNAMSTANDNMTRVRLATLADAAAERSANSQTEIARIYASADRDTARILGAAQRESAAVQGRYQALSNLITTVGNTISRGMESYYQYKDVQQARLLESQSRQAEFALKSMDVISQMQDREVNLLTKKNLLEAQQRDLDAEKTFGPLLTDLALSTNGGRSLDMTRYTALKDRLAAEVARTGLSLTPAQSTILTNIETGLEGLVSKRYGSRITLGSIQALEDSNNFVDGWRATLMKSTLGDTRAAETENVIAGLAQRGLELNDLGEDDTPRRAELTAEILNLATQFVSDPSRSEHAKALVTETVDQLLAVSDSGRPDLQSRLINNILDPYKREQAIVRTVSAGDTDYDDYVNQASVAVSQALAAGRITPADQITARDALVNESIGFKYGDAEKQAIASALVNKVRGGQDVTAAMKSAMIQFAVGNPSGAVTLLREKVKPALESFTPEQAASLTAPSVSVSLPDGGMKMLSPAQVLRLDDLVKTGDRTAEFPGFPGTTVQQLGEGLGLITPTQRAARAQRIALDIGQSVREAYGVAKKSLPVDNADMLANMITQAVADLTSDTLAKQTTGSRALAALSDSDRGVLYRLYGVPTNISYNDAITYTFPKWSVLQPTVVSALAQRVRDNPSARNAIRSSLAGHQDILKQVLEKADTVGGGAPAGSTLQGLTQVNGK